MSKYVKQRNEWYLLTGSKGDDGLQWGLNKWGGMVPLGGNLVTVESDTWPLTDKEQKEVLRRAEQIRIKAERDALPVAGFTLTVGEVELIIDRLLDFDHDYASEPDAECRHLAGKLKVLLVQELVE